MAVFRTFRCMIVRRGDKFGEFIGGRVTPPQKESERLLRLPLFYNLAPVDQRTVITTCLLSISPDMSLAKASCGRRSVRW